MSDQDDLKQLFAEATAGIRPQGTYDDIRTRTEKVDPMARRWFLPTIAAAAVMALVIGGAFWVTRGTGPGAPGPADLAPPVATPVYYAGLTAGVSQDTGDDFRSLFAELHEVSALPGTTQADPVEAVNLALSGTPDDGDYSSLWPAGVRATSVAITGSGDDRAIVVRLDGPFRERPDELSDRDQLIAISAVVRTAQEALDARDTGVRFDDAVGNGETVLGEDTLGVTYFAGGENTIDLAPVQITSPTNGATVPAGAVVVKGLAATFEANVLWEVMVGGDAVVMSGHTTAAECCDLSPYEFTVDLEPGSYTIVVHDEDMSGEGRAVNRDTKDIVVE